MYPTLSDFLKDIFGINVPLPIQSYGLMMALAFIAGTWIGIKEIKRKEAQGLFIPFYKKEIIGEPAKIKDLIISALISFFIGYKLLYIIKVYNTFAQNPEGVILSGEGSLLGGIIFAVGYTFYIWYSKEKNKLPKPKTVYKKVYPHELIVDIVVVAGIFGILGAKIFDALSNYQDYRTFELFTNFKEAWPEFSLRFFSFSGLAFLGGFIFGLVAVTLYLRKYNINFWQMSDVAALVLPLSYAIGRIGCQVSGDGCWGLPNTAPKPDWLSFIPDWAWAYDYPHNVLHVKLIEPVYPTPFYETTIMFVVFLILWAFRKKIKIPGVLFSIYLVLAGLERFFIEFIRHNNKYNIFGIHITQAQLISIFMILTGIIGIFYLTINKEKVLQWATPKEKEINRNPNEKQKQTQ